MSSGDSTSLTCVVAWNQQGKWVKILSKETWLTVHIIIIIIKCSCLWRLVSALITTFRFRTSTSPVCRCSSPQFVQQKLVKADFHGAVLTGLHTHIYRIPSCKWFAVVTVCLPLWSFWNIDGANFTSVVSSFIKRTIWTEAHLSLLMVLIRSFFV